MDRLRQIIGAVLALMICGLGSPSLAKPPAPPLIVISIDGFRADYFDRGLTPTLAALAGSGVHARAMRPSFPSVTDPNHYTLMTGLYPDHHGIVDNTMVDPAMPGLAFGGPHGKGVDDDPRWWNEATPLWVTAQRSGIETASSLWPGDTAVIHGVAPTYLEAREPGPTMDQQVDVALGWLDLPPDKRPGLIRLHLDVVDAMGHVFGPDHRVLNNAISRADAVLGRLVDGLKARGLYDKINIVVVSDHGMTGLPPNQVIYLDDLIDLKTVTVPAELAAAGIDPLPGHEAQVEKVLLASHDHMRCWRRGDIPARLHYGANPRVPKILCLGDLGWTIATRATLASYPPLHGNHGYDPAEPDMAALFLAHGPAFRSGVTLPAFDNVDVYPLLAKLLGVKPERNDGHLSEVAAALK
jgi:predicted AlkP superfamily pyrophosphatase or phosphodiesterase